MTLNRLIITNLIALFWSSGVAWAQCPKSGLVKVKLAAGDFDVPGYDAKRGLLAIRPRRTLAANADRPRPVKLRLTEENVYVHIAPNVLRIGLESGLSALEVILEGEPIARPMAAHRTRNCDVLIPRRVAIQRAGLIIARAAIKPVVKARSPVSIRSKISVERGQVQPRSLILITEKLAHECAQEMPHGGRGLKGAVSIQIETTLLGEVKNIKTVVDGLVNRPYTHCLIRTFRDSPRLWQLLEPATRAYLTFYLQPEGLRQASP